MGRGAPILSVVTGTRNRPDSLARLVRSVLANTADVDWELLIADASDANRPGYWHPSERIRVVTERPRLWPAAGYNRIVREHARGEWVAWVNDDVEATPRWALAMLSALSDRKDVGMGVFYFQDRHVYGPDWQVHEWPAGLLYANFGCLRRELFLEVGGFDERCPVYGMDNSLSLRVQDRGLWLLAVEGARLIHHRKMTPEREREHEESERFRDASVRVLIEDYGAKFPQLVASQGRWPWRRAIPFDAPPVPAPSLRGTEVTA